MVQLSSGQVARASGDGALSCDHHRPRSANRSRQALSWGDEWAGRTLYTPDQLRVAQQTSGRGVFVPLAFGPGEAFQFDWSEEHAVIGGERTKLQVAHLKLCHSRAFLVRAYLLQTHEMLFDAHNHGFRVLGGVPREVLYDKMRTVVHERDRYGHGQHRFHAGFLDFARHCGFRPRLCRPYRAQSKGKVERFIRYMRGNFWLPLASRMAAEGLVVDAAAANLAAGRWLREVANARRHATTGEVPADRLELERPQLGPILPPYGGQPRVAMAAASSPLLRPLVGLQHPLALYVTLFPTALSLDAAP